MVMLADRMSWTRTRGSAPAREDAFGYNDRSEVTSATLGTDTYGYSFDNIGNRITAEELTNEIAYTSNDLNQYTAIEKNSATPFVPTFDDDGNQLTVQTATGVWTVTYNAENRPITFTKDTTVIECKYDASGRRFEKKVTDNNVVTFWQRYVYKGFLQIAAFHVTLETVDEIETEVYTLATTTYWDPTEPIATRPLAFKDHTLPTPTTYFYTHDLTKNVCEVLSRNGSAVSIVTEYDYTPFGAVTPSNSATANTIMFSSEVLDPETALVYYNFRHYNPIDGRWTSRDPIEENGGVNLYSFVYNRVFVLFDIYGLARTVITLKDGTTRTLSNPTAEEFQKLLTEICNEGKKVEQLWLYGHGNSDIMYINDAHFSRTWKNLKIKEANKGDVGIVVMNHSIYLYEVDSDERSRDITALLKCIMDVDSELYYNGCNTATNAEDSDNGKKSDSNLSKDTSKVLTDVRVRGNTYLVLGVLGYFTIGNSTIFKNGEEQ